MQLTELREQAEKIAFEMNMQGLQPWHVASELEVRAVFPMYREELERLVKKYLESMKRY